MFANVEVILRSALNGAIFGAAVGVVVSLVIVLVRWLFRKPPAEEAQDQPPGE